MVDNQELVLKQAADELLKDYSGNKTVAIEKVFSAYAKYNYYQKYVMIEHIVGTTFADIDKISSLQEQVRVLRKALNKSHHFLINATYRKINKVLCNEYSNSALCTQVLSALAATESKEG